MTKTITGFASQLATDLISEQPSNDVAILAGDYVLGPDGQYAKNYGIYPDSSVEISSQIITQVREQIHRKIYMFTLINDWKFLVGNPRAEQIRRKYWSNPEFDLKKKLNPELQKHLLPGRGQHQEGIDPNLSLGRYSEQRLHNEYSHLLERGNRKESVGQLFDEIGLSSNESCKSEACSLNKCASEIVMILRNLYQIGIRRVIGLLPAECRNNIEIGTEIFSAGQAIFAREFKEPMVVDNHYLNCTGPQTEAELFEVNLPQGKNRHRIERL